MNEEAAFLRAICENPDDDTPRLVFADWLTEQGGEFNSHWARLIRAQVWQARGLADGGPGDDWPVFESESWRLQFQERLGIPTTLGRLGWDRGFPAEVVDTAAAIRAAWPGMAFRIPFRQLSMYDISEQAAADFVTWPGLSVLRVLSVNVLAAPGLSGAVGAIAGSESFRRLESLILTFVELTDATMEAILASPYLSGLQSLRLRFVSPNALSPEVAAQLAARFGPEVFEEAPF